MRALEKTLSQKERIKYLKVNSRSFLFEKTEFSWLKAPPHLEGKFVIFMKDFSFANVLLNLVDMICQMSKKKFLF